MWEDIIKNQITSGKQGILTSDSTLPKKKKPEDCYPPLYALFQQFLKLQNNLDPGKTLIMNWEHGFTPEELCKLKNEGTIFVRGRHDEASHRLHQWFYLATEKANAGENQVMVIFKISGILNEVHFNDSFDRPSFKKDYGDIQYRFQINTYRNKSQISESRPIDSWLTFDGYPGMVAAEDMQRFESEVDNFTQELIQYSNGTDVLEMVGMMEWYAEKADIIYHMFKDFYPEREERDE